MIDNIVLELFLIIFCLLLLYVVSFRYIIPVILLGLFVFVVVLFDFSFLSSVFDGEFTGFLFWSGVILFDLFLVLFKLAFYVDEVLLPVYDRYKDRKSRK